MELTEEQYYKALDDIYRQGRFDEYADRTGRKQAKAVRDRLNRQKNCPYCHDRANLLQSNDERPIDGDIVYINKDGYLNSETD
jgi:hypothetical protein